ncbi:MAG: thymidine kinase [Oscillospiraceae bacterium]|nr:thymidine kinase [Oscillospiraceae bacterium]
MSKLYFRYGTMNCSKSANALMTRFNYIERGLTVLLLKPAVDTRETNVTSRVGLSAPATLFGGNDDLYKIYEQNPCDCVIVDEAQFAGSEHIEQLRDIVDDKNVPVFCFGLRTDFRTRVFPGSLRLFELADSISEMKSICDCGNKANVNARFVAGEIAREGEQVFIGGNESYRSMCYKCWKKSGQTTHMK